MPNKSIHYINARKMCVAIRFRKLFFFFEGPYSWLLTWKIQISAPKLSMQIFFLKHLTATTFCKKVLLKCWKLHLCEQALITSHMFFGLPSSFLRSRTRLLIPSKVNGGTAVCWLKMNPKQKLIHTSDLSTNKLTVTEPGDHSQIYTGFFTSCYSSPLIAGS